MVVLSQEQNPLSLAIAEWKVAMMERLKLPDIGYSSGQLKVLAQLQVTISQGE